MVIKYIGRTHTFKGKPLWEILGNLKNHGVGRIVIRSAQQRYPEASYMRILKVVGLPDTSKHIHDPRKVMVLVEKVFRGQKSPILVQMDGATYKPDYVLIPKDQETKYTNETKVQELRIMPQTTDFPPLLKKMLIEKQGNPDLKLKLVYSTLGIKSYRVAEENETPTVEIKVGLGNPVSPSLYDNIKQKDAS
ncbi:uncharacterized protein LOC132913202 [Bombus pascuorum]|uniref:uncharacterized protein LOC132913202 n=1 Tax=Bombus pascuorum TaxID=65598 RepID=UPI00212D848C|nr:uncharacterized protein LOC132913202 [Bombus pascuorum]